MKKRRTLIISLLLVAALVLGIGYASITRDLSITGTAKSTPADIDVVFTDGTTVVSANSPTDDTARESAIVAASSVGSVGDKVISFNAFGLTNPGESVTAVFHVVNNNSYPVTLTAPTVEDGSTNTLDHFSVVVGTLQTTVDGSATALTGNLGAGQVAYFTVTVTLDSNDSAAEISESFHVHLNATGIAQ